MKLSPLLVLLLVGCGKPAPQCPQFTGSGPKLHRYTTVLGSLATTGPDSEVRFEQPPAVDKPDWFWRERDGSLRVPAETAREWQRYTGRPVLITVEVLAGPPSYVKGAQP